MPVLALSLPKIDDPAAWNRALNPRQKDRARGELLAIGGAKPSRRAKYYRFISELSERGGAISLAKGIEVDRVAIILQTSAKDKRSSLAKISHRQIEVGRHLGFAIFVPDLFDCLKFYVGPLLNQ